MKNVLISCLIIFLTSSNVMAGKIVSQPMSQSEKDQFLEEFKAFDAAESIKRNTAQLNSFSQEIPATQARPASSSNQVNPTSQANSAVQVNPATQANSANQVDSVNQASPDNQANLVSNRHEIRISYKNDASFNYEYYDSGRNLELSAAELNKFKQAVFDYFLGSGYEGFNPVLRVVVKDRVSIQLTISPSELLTYLGDSRISALVNKVVEKQNRVEWNSSPKSQ